LLTPAAAAAESLPARSGAGETCFHCGLEFAPADRADRALIDGQWRCFCCPGCEAVARTILEQGLGDYYRLRTASPARGGGDSAAPAAPAAFDAYDDPGFQATFVRDAGEGTREASLVLDGIRCAACVWLGEQAIRRLPGVTAASVNYATRRALVRWRPERIALSGILAAVARVGYRAFPYDERRLDAIRRSERRRALWRLFVAGFAMMQVMMYAYPSYIAGDGTLTADAAQLLRWAGLVLTLPVVGYAAQPFYAGAARDLRAGRLGMDVPVSLGVAIAFAASAWATLRGAGEVYYDSIAMFVFLLLGGRFLELEARRRAAGALEGLGRLVPAFAARLTEFPASLATERVAAAALRPGDLLLVRPGETIAADGTVVQGRGEVAEAALTGESAPRGKAAGSAVIGGSVNLAAPLVIRVDRVGGDTVLAGIVRLVERALAERQPLVELADRYAHWFVVAVLLLAAATAVAWLRIDPDRALWVAVSVLVVTCPCALSLATPVALTVATGELARRGFLVTRGHAIETLARATDVVLDKTGTLTHGELRIVAAAALGREPLAACVALASALEQASEHPAGRALVRYADELGAPAPVAGNLSNDPGGGVEGTVAGRRLRVGSPRFCSALAGPLPGVHAAPADSPGTRVMLAADGEWLARFELGDALKPDAGALVARLGALGKRVHLLSGDASPAVDRVAAALGIARVVAGAAPDAKQAYVRGLKAQGAVVAMVGDGVNDAPVLAQADVSIAMGQGADLARTQSDAVLVAGELERLAEAAELALRTARIVRQNLGWAIAYNLAAVPAAAAGLVTPWMAGVGMAASSLVVVLNALRLCRPATAAGSR
jgi:Cu2+-exporting ATPase